MWCIIDIETTGVSKHRGKITEIAIYKHDGKKVVDEFVSLINPETSIPFDISRLTGITNQMVQNAPKFYEVAKDVISITEDCVFVAHNVNFDYGFIEEEFDRLGYDFQRKKMCTVKQSRVLLPGHRSYSLGKLCRDLNIILDGRHRAAGDAKATVKLFELLYAKDPKFGLKLKPEIQLSKYLHPELDVEKVLSIPKKIGIYYLYNAKKEVIYVGKSTNLRTRLNNHLRQPKTQKAIKMHAEVADISYEITGSEIVALLKESQEIKNLKPKYNVALRRSSFPFGIIEEHDLFGYHLLRPVKLEAHHKPISSFSSIAEAKGYLEKVYREFGLCLGMIGLQKCNRGCVFFGTQQCEGAALCHEEADTYNLKVENALENLRFINRNLLIIEPGPNNTKKSVIVIENGSYLGIGEISEEENLSLTEILDTVKPMQDDRDSRGIIGHFLRNRKLKKMVEFDRKTNSAKSI